MKSIIILLLLCTPCFAQVVYNGTNEQRNTGIYKSITIKANPKDSVVEISDVQKNKIISKTCASFEGQECKPSEHFKAKFSDSIIEIVGS